MTDTEFIEVREHINQPNAPLDAASDSDDEDEDGKNDDSKDISGT